ncbi:amino acid permease [Roseiconus nitratireducens]|uniref:Amino acid permease n=1 Tax=Roseiconus nitratireducens TaxID=2605748 RepID=A0A5M6D8B6_9BACT|nr:amino acid permease [Roseiconus nitratireducens]KAA5542552.1 amino acid permease [Roseiconus nitratireducens]
MSDLNRESNPYAAGRGAGDRDVVQETSSADEAAGKMGVPSAAAVVVASMIGAGVYTTSGFTLADLGTPGWVVLAWGVGGVIAICGALCYGALAQQLTESGGEYLFLARAVHPAAGMMAGWVSLLAGFTGAIAFAATTLEAYARGFEVGWITGVPQNVIAIGVIVVAALVHGAGLRRGSQIQNAVVVVKLILITAFLVIAFAAIGHWQGGGVARQAAEEGSVGGGWPFVLAFANALTWISLSYSGFNAAVYLAGEVRRPAVSVPRAMWLATAAVTVLYLMLNTVFVYAPKADEVAGRPDVASAAADAIGRQLGWESAGGSNPVGTLVRIAIVVGLVTSVSALMQTGPRVYQKMAEDGFLPRWLSGGPGHARRAILIQAGLAILVVCVSTLRQQLDYLGFTLSVCAALCGSLVFFLRGNTRYDVRVRFYPIVPVIYVFGTLVIAALTAIRAPVQAGVGLATLLLGVVVYYWHSRVA